MVRKALGSSKHSCVVGEIVVKLIIHPQKFLPLHLETSTMSVVITGLSAGIGSAMVNTFAWEGHPVLAVARRNGVNFCLPPQIRIPLMGTAQACFSPNPGTSQRSLYAFLNSYKT